MLLELILRLYDQLQGSGLVGTACNNMTFRPLMIHSILPLQQFTAAHHMYFGTQHGVELCRYLLAGTLGQANVLRGCSLAQTIDRAVKSYKSFLW